ncbi:MAG: translocation/assembly module TamB domain-containing protein, partial [Candidatus Eisenbacteria bacterium]
DLDVIAQDFRVMESRDLAAMASGKLHVAGSPSAPEVSGDVALHDTNVYLAPASGDTAEIELTARDWRMLEDTFGAVDDTAPDLAQRLYAAARFGVQVKLTGDCWVRQRTVPRLEVELRGAFRFDKAPGGQPVLHGRVAPAPDRGFVEQFARRFTFTGGDIQLNGPMAEHQLDIKTEYKASSSLSSSAARVVVHLDVQGTLERLRLLLSSEPAMEQSEIISYIISGQTARERTGAGSGSQRAMAAAIPLQLGIAQLAGPIEELARQKVGLDVVEVRQDGLQGATVVAGRFLDPRLYVGFRQPLAAPARNTRGPANDGTRTRFELEYSAFEWLVLNLQGETSRLRSFVRVSRAY